MAHADPIFEPPVVQVSDGRERLRRDPESFLADCRAAHGPIFAVPVEDSTRLVFVLDPHLFHALLTRPEVDFAPISRQSKTRFGLDRLVATQDDVRALSRDFVKALRGTSLDALAGAFAAGLAARTAAYRSALPPGGAETTAQALADELIMPSGTEALFGASLFDADFAADFHAFNASMATRVAGTKASGAASGADARKRLLARLAALMAKLDTPVLAQLGASTFRREGLSEEEKHLTLLMILWGSLVNLMPASAWIMAALAHSPGLAGQVRASEGDERDHILQSIVTETLRLYGRTNIYREVTATFELEREDEPPVRFMAGDWIALFPQFLHHDASVFGQAEAFVAERFVPPAGAKRARFAYQGRDLTHPVVVFGLGRGRCPGDAYAVAVLAATVDTLARALDLTPLDAALPPPVSGTVASTPGPAAPIRFLVRAL